MRQLLVLFVFGLPLPVLHFVADPHTLGRLCINSTKLNFQFFFSKRGNNCSEHNN